MKYKLLIAMMLIGMISRAQTKHTPTGPSQHLKDTSEKYISSAEIDHDIEGIEYLVVSDYKGGFYKDYTYTELLRETSLTVGYVIWQSYSQYRKPPWVEVHWLLCKLKNSNTIIINTKP
jgi:hypothetical protein